MGIKVVLVANPKGGAGKSTLATNLAGMLAHRGWQDGTTRVMLGDADRQQSARGWLSRRPGVLPPIAGWEVAPGKPARPPKSTTHVVLDTPAGLAGDTLKRLVKLSTHVIVPVQPSMFDLLATQSFLSEMADLKAAQGLPVAVVGMRVDDRTRAAEQFRRFVETSGLPLLTTLRDTQVYVQLAAHGMTVFDLPAGKAARDLAQWEAVAEWI